MVEGEQLEHHELPTHDEMEQDALGVEPAAIPKMDSLGQPRYPQFYDRELDVSLACQSSLSSPSSPVVVATINEVEVGM